MLGDGTYINTGLTSRTANRPGRPLLKDEEEDNAAHRKVRARVEHVIDRMKNDKILRDCRQHGNGLHHAVQAAARMHGVQTCHRSRPTALPGFPAFPDRV
ncbi:hypothetical protein GA0115260_102423 [Streptomyces sp. MnatMP-M27]|nr:hypothetical protein GA0115260_102423 [Streptomyces sp. MnatMP-M27]